MAGTEPKIILPETAGKSHPLRPPPDPPEAGAPKTAGRLVRASHGAPGSDRRPPETIWPVILRDIESGQLKKR